MLSLRYVRILLCAQVPYSLPVQVTSVVAVSTRDHAKGANDLTREGSGCSIFDARPLRCSAESSASSQPPSFLLGAVK